MKLATPAAADATESLADWMEFEALRSKEEQTSVEDLVRVIRRTGSTDAFDESNADRGSEVSQIVAQDAFSEVENRKIACGNNGYPFDIEQGLLRLKSKPEDFPYILLLLMSATTPTAGHQGTAALFERMCTQAALEYLGGTANGAGAIRFGSPRKTPLAQLNQAIDDLCVRVAEGGGCKISAKAKHLGDEGLDVVAWRHFPDTKEGKLIAFGQCAGSATGWQQKLIELDSRKFIQKWFREILVVDPIHLFFVPRRIPRDDWHNAGIDGGILFDRCRIVACMTNPTQDLARECRASALRMIAEARSQ
jgi:hypothetical protein